MTNNQKAKEIANVCENCECMDANICDKCAYRNMYFEDTEIADQEKKAIFDASIKMAKWKDEQFKYVLNEVKKIVMRDDDKFMCDLIASKLKEAQKKDKI